MSMPPIPEGWTKERDRDWFKQRFKCDREDARAAALERLWYERSRLEAWLGECISTFIGAKEFDPEPLAQSLGSVAKVDLLLAILQSGSPQPANFDRVQKDLGQAKATLEACDQIVFRSLLQPQTVWLLEVAPVAEELAFSGWQLKQSVRREYEYKPRSSASVNVPS
jgi:hypothetical protein